MATIHTIKITELGTGRSLTYRAELSLDDAVGIATALGHRIQGGYGIAFVPYFGLRRYTNIEILTFASDEREGRRVPADDSIHMGTVASGPHDFSELTRIGFTNEVIDGRDYLALWWPHKYGVARVAKRFRHGYGVVPTRSSIHRDIARRIEKKEMAVHFGHARAMESAAA